MTTVEVPKGVPELRVGDAVPGALPWRGFGGCFNELGAIALAGAQEADRKAVMKELFDPEAGCRFDFGRIPIGASDFAESWYSCDEEDGDFAMRGFSLERDRVHLLPYIQEALGLHAGLTLFASPWSPPTWMKRPRAYNYGKFVMRQEYLEAYALYFSKFVQGYAREGVRIAQVHPQNEPCADQKFPSCVWSGAELRDFIRDHLGPRMRADGSGAEVWLGTLNMSDYACPHAVLSDPGARAFVAGVGVQWDAKAFLHRLAAAWPELPFIQTENECGDGKNTWDYAMYVFGLAQHYLAAGAVGYVYWNMVLPEGGRSTWGWTQNAMVSVSPLGAVTRNPEYYVMKHLSRYIRPGAARLRLSGEDSAYGIAYRNVDGSVVVALANVLPEAKKIALESGASRWGFDLPPRSIHTFIIPG